MTLAMLLTEPQRGSFKRDSSSKGRRFRTDKDRFHMSKKRGGGSIPEVFKFIVHEQRVEFKARI